jgi:hypothetical protein
MPQSTLWDFLYVIARVMTQSLEWKLRLKRLLRRYPPRNDNQDNLKNFLMMELMSSDKLNRYTTKV